MAQRLKKWPFVVPISLAFVVALACAGCVKEEPENHTVPGLQEQAKVRQGQIQDLNSQVVGLKSEKEAVNQAAQARIEEIKKEKEVVNQAAQARIEEIKKEYEVRQTKIEEIHRSKLTQLEGEISDLRLELGAIQREKIAFQEILDRAPRIEVANSARKGYDIVVFGVMLAVLIGIILFVVYRYRSVHDRLNLLTMQQASELRRIGAKP